jgi:hypothetical protein
VLRTHPDAFIRQVKINDDGSVGPPMLTNIGTEAAEAQKANREIKGD